jgi:small subunit ribosomal protein S3Ae
MAVGKNKRLSKGGKKGMRKKLTDVMLRKEWYDVIAPATFTKDKRQFCKTLCNKTIGQKLSVDNLRHRVFETNLADLQGDEELGFRKFKLRIEDVQGRTALTQFWGMDMTTDKLRSLLRKWCTLIEDVVEAKTADGYFLRIFIIAFTRKQPNQVKKPAFANSAKVRDIRRKMTQIVTSEVNKGDINAVVKKFQLESETICKEIEEQCKRIYPLRDVHIRKVKMLRTPKFEVQKLLDAHDNDVPTSREGLGAAASQAVAAVGSKVEDADE